MPDGTQSIPKSSKDSDVISGLAIGHQPAKRIYIVIHFGLVHVLLYLTTFPVIQKI
jgi:hypothetical protein